MLKHINEKGGNLVRKKKWVITVIIIAFICSVYTQTTQSAPQGPMMGPTAGISNQGMLSGLPGAFMALAVDPVVAALSTNPSIGMGITPGLGMGISPGVTALISSPAIMNPLTPMAGASMPSIMVSPVTPSPPLIVNPAMGNQGLLPGMGISPLAPAGVSPGLNMGILPGAPMALPGAVIPLQGTMISMMEPMTFILHPFMEILSPMMGIPRSMPVMPSPMMSLNPMMGINPMMNMNPIMGMTYPTMGMNPMMNMGPNMSMNPMMNMPEMMMGPPLVFPIFQLPQPTIPAAVATSPVRTANVVVVPFAGDSCIFCHEDLTLMTGLGYPEFYFLLDTVQAETGMPATCVDCPSGMEI